MKSFRNTDGVLTAWGYAEANGSDLARDEADDFALEPGKWQLVNDAWMTYVQPAPIPSSVSPAQAKIALLEAGLLAQIEAQIAAADQATQIAWNSATAIERESPTVAMLAGILNLNDQQLDELFAAAAAIRI